MTREEVLQALSAWLRGEFGKLIAPRDVRRVRHAAGTTWVAKIVVPAPSGEIPMGELEIDEEGNIVEPLTVEKLIEALRRPKEEQLSASDAGDMGDLMGGFEDFAPAADEDLDQLDHTALYARAASLAASNDEVSLKKARDLMPRLLADPDKRTAVLVWMAVVERKLDNVPIALQHLEAAARDFADRFDLPALEKLAALTHELMGDEEYPKSPIKRLLDESKEKMQPVGSIFECPQFLALPSDDRDFLGDNLKLRVLQRDENLVREGEPSRNVYVIKSGLIGVHLELPEGGTRLVRTCYPGWLLGESSVLVPDDPRCTATLRAETETEVWVIEGTVLKQVLADNPDVKYRIEATKHLHRIDSFFSMHETLSQLEAIVRDEMLACIRRISHFEEASQLIEANEPPKVACLVMTGEVNLLEGAKVIGTVGADRFIGVRDAMHAIAPPVTAMARPGATIAFFDAEMLRKLAEKSPEAVIAVLERLG